MPESLSRDGLRIYYESSGQGIPVVLLHPNHATSRSRIELGWFRTLESMGCPAVSLDARGFGRSDPASDPERLAPGTSTDDITAVMDAIAIDAAHLCGFSLGAAPRPAAKRSTSARSER